MPAAHGQLCEIRGAAGKMEDIASSAARAPRVGARVLACSRTLAGGAGSHPLPFPDSLFDHGVFEGDVDFSPQSITRTRLRVEILALRAHYP
jgi:hypothetical protein